MRKIAFIISILGMGLLFLLLLDEPIKISSLDGLVVGELVNIEGVVEQQRKFGNGVLMFIEDIPVFCECNNNYAGLNVSIVGIIENFPQDLRIRVFKIEVLS